MSTSGKFVLAILAVFAVLVWLMPLAAGVYYENQERKKRGEPDPSKAEFDERQRLIRLEASQHALYALGGYLLLWMVLDYFGVPLARTYVLLAVGVLLAMTVWSGECILRDAMLGFNQRKAESGQVIMYFSLGICWTVIGSKNLEAASSSLGVAQIFFGGSYLLMGLLMLFARRRRKRLDGEA